MFGDLTQQLSSQAKNWLMPSPQGPLEKARITVGKQSVEVMYNPTELTLTRSVETNDDSKAIKPQPKRVKSEDLIVTLFFDTFEAQTDVTIKTNPIVELTRFAVPTDQRKMPPVVIFSWGKNDLFSGIVTRVEQTFTMFLPDGTPVRATLKVTFSESPTPKELNADAGLTNCRMLWTVSPGDRLYLIAQQALGDSTQWRLIADANGIRDVLAFPTTAQIGSILVIPDTHGETFEPQGEPSYV
jgi:nucleoid-associated protein YgaU